MNEKRVCFHRWSGDHCQLCGFIRNPWDELSDVISDFTLHHPEWTGYGGRVAYRTAAYDVYKYDVARHAEHPWSYGDVWTFHPDTVVLNFTSGVGSYQSELSYRR